MRAKRIKNLVKRLTIFSSIVVIVFGVFAYSVPFTKADQLSDLEDQINAINGQKSGVEKEIAEFEGAIRQKQEEQASLSGQISIIQDSISQIELKIQNTQLEMDQTRLKIDQLNLRIEQTKQKIEDNKNRLAELLRLLYRYQDKSLLEVLLTNDSLSQFFDEVRSVETIQGEGQRVLDEVKRLKGELENNLLDLEKQKAELENLQKDLENQQKELEGSKKEKENLLNVTKGQEAEYQTLLENKKADAASINNQILDLQREIDEIRRNNGGEDDNYDGSWVWPQQNPYVITCVFHCGNYFPGMVHTGVDIAAYDDDAPIVSATSGYVVHAGWFGGYGNAVVISSGEYLIIYGHQSALVVSENSYVSAGQQIGYQGSTGFSTGPHLHFEVRHNGTPIDPMQFY